MYFSMNIVRDILSSRNFDNILLNVPKGYKINNRIGNKLKMMHMTNAEITAMIYLALAVGILVSTLDT